MKRRVFASLLLLSIVVAGGAGWAYWQAAASAPAITEAAQKFLGVLEHQQKKSCQLPYNDERRVGWHFIPKDERKGAQIKHMTPPQKKAALALLHSALSERGYKKAARIMALEGLLAELEKDRDGGPIRDSERYYVTIFGTPKADERWGLSFEGHHLSLNFVIEGDDVVSSTPAFFAANPGTVKNAGAGFEIGDRVLRDEEQLAFDLVESFDGEQRAVALIADKAPREIRGAGEPQPPADAAVGIVWDKLEPQQQALLRQLIASYAVSMPRDVARGRLGAISDAGIEEVHFAWAGATEPGVGHYYRVQGPTFLIEFVNTQPDAAGNPANHIHCVWRDMHGDFALPLKK